MPKKGDFPLRVGNIFHSANNIPLSVDPHAKHPKLFQLFLSFFVDTQYHFVV